MLFDCEVCGDNVCLLKLQHKMFSKFSLNDQIQIVRKGRCVPKLQLKEFGPKPNYCRNFHVRNYDKYKWLCGCVHSNKLYCFPCLLFGNHYTKTAWISGYAKLHNFPTAVRKHEQAEKHLESSMKLLNFEKSHIVMHHNCTTENALDIERHNAIVQRNRNLFQRLIDVVCFLGMQEFAYHHREESSSVNRSNFLEAVDLLAKYDGVLETHLQNGISIAGMSDRTQNYLISSIASVISDAIREEIKQSTFVALMVEETPDERGKEQLVVILRYLRDSEIVDRFIKYIDVSADRTAATLSPKILEILEDYGCLKKLIAQTYEGRAILSSDVYNVQALVREICPAALHVWCSAHVLNLVLCKTFQESTETKYFFSVIKSITAFFHTNTKRMAYYNNFADVKNLPHVTGTNCAVNIINNELTHLLKMFEEIIENPENWDGDTLDQASRLLFSMKEFEFNFMLKTFADIFSETDILYDFIQKSTSDIANCVRKIEKLETFLERYRDNFEINYDETVHISGLPKRKPNVDDVKIHYKRIFIEIIDNIVSEIKTRYVNIKKLKFIELLSSKKFGKYSERFPKKETEDFINTNFIKNCMETFNFDKFKNELRCIYRLPEFRNCDVYSLIEYLNQNDLTSIFSEALKFAQLINMIPASNASTERSFSYFNRIHTYLKNTQNQPRLTDASLISIEKALLVELKRKPTFYDDVLKSYLEKDRREDLIYK